MQQYMYKVCFSKLPDLKLKLSEAQEEHALMEMSLRETIAHLNVERKKLLDISIERGKSIQVNLNDLLLIKY